MSKQGSRGDAQARIDQIRMFEQELRHLTEEDVGQLTDAQLQSIRTYHAGIRNNLALRHDIDLSSSAKQLSLGMRIVSFLGALSLAASVFFLFYRIWGYVPTFVQVVLLISAPLVSFSFTMWLRTRDHTGYFTKLAAMVSFACFVLNLVMRGHMFSVTASEKAFLVWGAFALTLAYGCNARLLLATAILCLDAFIAARCGSWAGLYWLDFGRRPETFFPAVLLLLAVPSLFSQDRFDNFGPIYRVFGLLTLFGPILVLSNWGQGSLLPIDPDAIEGAYQVAGFLLASVAIWLGVRSGLPEVVNTSVTFFVVLLYTKFYDWWWAIMPKYLFFFILGLTALLFLFVLRRLREATRDAQPEIL